MLGRGIREDQPSEAFFPSAQPMRTRLGGAAVLETGIRFAVSRQSDSYKLLTKSKIQSSDVICSA